MAVPLEKIAEEMLKAGLKTKQDLDCFKRKMAKKYKTECLKNVLLLQMYHKLAKKPIPCLENILKIRPVRSLSGVINVSVLTKPWPCLGKCIFCPSQKGLPKSYLAKEPAVQRAMAAKFSPSKQIKARLLSLSQTGHPTDKIEIRVIGGTWSYYPKPYQAWFVKECLRACNNFSKKRISNLACRQTGFQSCLSADRFPIFNQFSISLASLDPAQRGNFQTLKREQKRNEGAGARVVGISVETRPDCINAAEIKQMREMGITKVELGVQTIFDDILRFVQRGHAVAKTIEATKMLKNAGFKVAYQLMPNLPKSNPKKDLILFRRIFSDPDFRPDAVKIYPLALLKNTRVYELYKKNRYKPYDEKTLAKILVEIKKQIPFWCRVERIIRDIPKEYIIEGGAKISNFREIAQKLLQEQGFQCKCIKCREVKANYNSKEKPKLFREDYKASGSQEVFLSFENKARTKLFALLRLRLNGKQASVFPALKEAAIVRELHTFGPLAKIVQGQTPHNFVRGLTLNQTQHRGFGKKLVLEAEKIAQKNGCQKMVVIAGIGARNYWRGLGYRLEETYMVRTMPLK